MDPIEILYSVITKMALKKSIKKIPLAIWSFIKGGIPKENTQNQERAFLLNLCNARSSGNTLSFANQSNNRHKGICLYLMKNPNIGIFESYDIMATHSGPHSQEEVSYTATYKIHLLEQVRPSKSKNTAQPTIVHGPLCHNYLQEVPAKHYQSLVIVNNEAKQTDEHLRTIKIQHRTRNNTLPPLQLKTEYKGGKDTKDLLLEIRLLEVAINK